MAIQYFSNSVKDGSIARTKIQVPDNNTSKVLTLARARMRIHKYVKKSAPLGTSLAGIFGKDVCRCASWK
jgi:hypothetical protein